MHLIELRKVKGTVPWDSVNRSRKRKKTDRKDKKQRMRKRKGGKDKRK